MISLFVATFAGGFVGAFAGFAAARAVGAWLARRAWSSTAADGGLCLKTDPNGRPCLRLADHDEALGHFWGEQTADSVQKRP